MEQVRSTLFPEVPLFPSTSEPCQAACSQSSTIPEPGVERHSLLLPFDKAEKQQQLVANSKAGLFPQDQQDSRQTAGEPICK